MSESKLKAPRGTFDVLGEQAVASQALEARARAILGAAGYERIETPVFESTELFARGVGASTDIVSKEMFTFEDGGGRSLTLRPEGTAPVCRAYIEHGMHKRRQPVKLWYLSCFFRHERAQAGRYREFWQVGAEALGSDDPAVDAEAISLLAALLADLGVRETRLRLSSLGSPETRGEYRERLQAHLRANEDRLSEEVRGRIELNPLRAFDTDHPGTREVMASAPLLLDQLDSDDREHFERVKSLLDAAGVAYEIDPTLVRGLDYYTRTVFEFTSRGARGAERRRRRRALRPSRPAARRPADPGHGLGGRDRADPAGGRAAARAGAASSSSTSRSARMSRSAPRRVRAPRRGPLGGPRRADGAWAGRALKGQLSHASSLGARFVAIVGREETALRDMQGGGQETVPADTVVHAVLRSHHAL